MHERSGRTQLIEAVDATLERSRKSAAILVGLDRFGPVNDAFGLEVAERMLDQVGRRLAGAAAGLGAGPVARFEGDVFGIVVPTFRIAAELRHAATCLLEAVRAPLTAGANQVRLTASAGIAAFPGDGGDAPDLLRAAGTALRRAKADGGRCYRFFAGAMGDEALHRLALENQLAAGWERGELTLHYQPILALGAGHAPGVEALLRWQHPIRGIVPAGAFMAAAESSGLIDAMESWTVREACLQATRWEREGHGPLDISVNLTARPFGEGRLVETVSEALAAAGLAARRLVLEITESAFVRQAERTARTLERLRALGVRLALDDFGTGYSNLAYLRRVPVDLLKIDRCFVGGLGEDPRAERVIAPIVALARGLGLETVAEGVETADQLAHLRLLGCDAVQGYYFAPALPAAQVPVALARIAQLPSLRAPTRAASSTALFTPIFSKILAR